MPDALPPAPHAEFPLFGAMFDQMNLVQPSGVAPHKRVMAAFSAWLVDNVLSHYKHRPGALHYCGWLYCV